MDSNTLEIALWVGGGFFSVIAGLLTWIGIMQKETKQVIFQKNIEQDARLNKHDEKFDKVHEEIKTLAVSIAAGGKRRK